MIVSNLRIFQTIFVLSGIFAGGLAAYYWKSSDRKPAFKISFWVTSCLVMMLLAEMQPYVFLYAFGEKANETVTKVDCQVGEKHHVYYQLQIDGHFFNGVSADAHGNPSCDFLKSGSVGVGYYLTNAPSVNLWGNPGYFLFQRLIALFMVLIFAPIASYCGARRLGS